MIEITGVAGGGKTTFLRHGYSDEVVLLGGMPLCYGRFRRVFYSILLALYAIVTGELGYRKAWWLAKKAVKNKESLFTRINALRNSLTKFGYLYYKRRHKYLIVDEGISHIPFILDLGKSDVEGFVSLFEAHLKKIEIIFVEAPPAEILETRIMTRGHSSVNSEDDAKEFVKHNLRIAEHYKNALINAGNDVTFVEV